MQRERQERDLHAAMVHRGHAVHRRPAARILSRVRNGLQRSPQPVGDGAQMARNGQCDDHGAHGSNGPQRLVNVTPQRTNPHKQPVGVGVSVGILRNWPVAAIVCRRHAKDRVTSTAPMAAMVHKGYLLSPRSAQTRTSSP